MNGTRVSNGTRLSSISISQRSFRNFPESLGKWKTPGTVPFDIWKIWKVKPEILAEWNAPKVLKDQFQTGWPAPLYNLYFDSFLLVCTSFVVRIRGIICFVYLLSRLAN